MIIRDNSRALADCALETPSHRTPELCTLGTRCLCIPRCAGVKFRFQQRAVARALVQILRNTNIAPLSLSVFAINMRHSSVFAHLVENICQPEAPASLSLRNSLSCSYRSLCQASASA